MATVGGISPDTRITDDATVSNFTNINDNDDTTKATFEAGDSGGSPSPDNSVIGRVRFPSQSIQGGVLWIKNDWSSSVVNPAGGRVKLEYTLNGGGLWNTIYDITTENSGESRNDSVILGPMSDLSQVEVRFTATATSSGGGDATFTLDAFEVWIIPAGQAMGFQHV